MALTLGEAASVKLLHTGKADILLTAGCALAAGAPVFLR